MPFDPNDPTAHLVDARAHTALSPRVQASVAVAKGLEIRAAVARQVQAPDLDLLFQGKNTDLALTNRSQLFGRDLDFTESTIAELGVRQTVSRNIELNVAAYDASRPSEIVSRIVQLPDPAQNGEIGDFRVLTNADVGHVRGLDVSLDGRVSSVLSGAVAYGYQHAKTTLPTHAISGWAGLRFPAGWRSGTLLGTVLQDGGLFATFRWTSGRHYTRELPVAAGYTTDAPGGSFIEPLNASALPWSKTVDVRVTRGVRLAKLDGTVFLESRNLFDFTNVVGRFTEVSAVTYQDLHDRFVSEQQQLLSTEAAAAGILIGNGSIDFNALGGCQNWQGRNSGGFASGPVDCVLLERAERRFGDGVFTQTEYTRAFDVWYNFANAPYRFYGPGRRIRVGLELAF